MKLRQVGSNMTEIYLQNVEHGDVVLFSYQTPVAAYLQKEGWIRTSKYWSRTTSKHISKWMGQVGKEKPQEFFDELANQI